MTQPYLVFTILLVFVALMAAILIGLSHLVAPRKPTVLKGTPYESGMPPLGSARERFSVKFYLIGMIFILFDIEVIFLIPWAVVFKILASPAYGMRMLIYVEMMVFVVLLLAGYVYILKKGAFDWSEKARIEAEAEARALKDMQERRLRTTRTAA